MGPIALAKADLGETGACGAFDCALGVRVSALALGLGEGLAFDLGLGAVALALPVALGGAKEDGRAALPRGLGGVLALALAAALELLAGNS